MTTRKEHKYTRERIFTTPFEILWYAHIRGMSLTSDWILKPGELGGEPEYQRVEYWTDEKKEDLSAKGYKEANGLHDSIFWSGTRRYAKIHNGKEFPIEEYYPAKKDTAYTLNDAMLSNSEKNFKKSMARAQLTATADWQKLGLMALLGVGVIVATKYFGIW